MQTRFRLGLIVLVVVSLAGCSTWKTPTSWTEWKRWNPMEWLNKEYQIPASMAVIWAPDVLNVPGKTPTRGFGGRIYFYNNKNQAIPVDGDLIVHGYLTTGERGKQPDLKVEADKTFVFTAEQLTSHFSPSQLGASYSIWIPWDAVGGYREEITLIPTFKSRSGHIVQGAPARLYLPGKAREGEEEIPETPPEVAYKYSQIPTYDLVPKQSPAPEIRSSGVETTTITIPPESTLLRTMTAGRGRQGVELGDSTRPNNQESARPSWELPPKTSTETSPADAPTTDPVATSDSNVSTVAGSGSPGFSTQQRPTFQLQPWTQRRAQAIKASPASSQ